MLRSRLARILAAFIVGTGLMLTTSGVAKADPAGFYYYICVGLDGRSYGLQPGEKLSDCKGAYLQKYSNGVLISAIPLTIEGKPARLDVRNIDCLIAVVGDVAAVATFTPTGWAYVGLATAGIGTLRSCRA